MIPLPYGCTARIVTVASVPEELDNFEPLERTLPEFTRVVLEIPLDPSEDISFVAQQVEQACLFYSIPFWPEYPTTHTVIEDNVLYVTYVKTSPWVQFIMPVLIGIMIIGPIIMWFVSEQFREMIQLMITLPILMLMMTIMKKMVPALKSEPEKVKPPKEKLPPWEERVSARLDRLGERIASITSLFTVSAPRAIGEVVDVASEIASIARKVRAAPETVMSGYEKAKAAKKMTELHRRLAEYEEHLTPEQKEKLEEERQIVEKLREEVF